PAAAGRVSAPTAAAVQAAAQPLRVASPAAPPYAVPAPARRPAPPTPEAPAPASQRARPSAEPPPWLDDVPFEADSYQSAGAPEAPPDDRAGDAAGDPVPETAAAAPPAANALAAIVSSPEPIEVPRSPLGDRWAEQVAALQGESGFVALVRELAMQAQLSAIEPDGEQELWRLCVERESLRAPPLVEKLQTALKVRSGLALRLEVVAGVALDSPARREAERIAKRQREAERLIQADPLVQAMLAQFSSARIVPGSIKPV
ncbi:MAG TPA: hypothetical protein VLA16_17235, partial [Ideonella sp.]|nr:hypothetical protein [Ideonella sp.]